MREVQGQMSVGDQASLRKNERKFQLLVEAIPQIVWITEESGLASYYSSFWYEYTGITPGTLDADTNQSVVHAEDLPAVLRAWNGAISAKQPFEYQLRLRRKDGVYRWFSARSFPIMDPSGQVAGWFGNSTDIHSSKVSELRARSLQSISAALLMARSPAEVARVIAREGKRAFGAAATSVIWNASGAEPIEVLAAEGYPSELVAVFGRNLPSNSPLLECIRTGKPIYMPDQKEWLKRHPSDSVTGVYPAWAAIPLFDQGEPCGAIGLSYLEIQEFGPDDHALAQVIVDQCSQALAKSFLQQEQEKLLLLARQAVEARDSLISISSHELLTPVTSMLLQTQLLRKKLTEGEEIPRDTIEKLVSLCERQLGRLQQLVSDMLDLSRINAGKLTLRKLPTDLVELIAGTVDRMSTQTERAGIQIRLDLEPGIAGEWDPYRLEQVLINLLANACRYAPGKPVEISARRSQSQAVLIDVRDFGGGIDPKDHDRIFQRFERAATRNDGVGLGLGLFISRQIVEAHGGSLRLTSALGEGALFRIELPS